MNVETNPIFYEFEGHRVDAVKRILWRDDEQISLTPKVFETLLVFLEHRGEVLEKETLIGLLWPESFVEESNLTQNVAVLRKALGEDSKQHRFILTIPGRGYQFVAKVEELYVEAPASAIENDENAHTSTHARKTEGSRIATQPGLRSRTWITGAVILVLATILGVSIWYFRDRNTTIEGPIIARSSQLTSWSGLDCFPTISPDGNTVAFSSDRTGSFEIYIQQVVTGAKVIQITSDGGNNMEPAFSADGAFLAYYSKKKGGIWVVPSSGGVARKITEFGSYPAWSPDGKQIAFQSDPLTSVDFNPVSVQPPSVIWIVSSDGGDPKQLTHPGQPEGGHGAPNWSPDGKRVAFDSGYFGRVSIWSVSVQGGELTRLTPETENCNGAVFSQDGKSLFLAADRGSSLKMIVIDDDGNACGDPIKVFDASGSRFRQISIGARGKRIVFAAISTTSDIWALSMLPSNKPAAELPVQLSRGKNVRHAIPVFSPDGKNIAFNANKVGTKFGLWMMDSYGLESSQLNEDGGTPSWTSDGKNIDFVATRDGQTSYFTISVDDRRETKLVDLEDNAFYTRLSPDGRTIAYNINRDGATNIWLRSLDNGVARQLTFDKEMAAYPAWSPDGKWLAFELKRGDDTHLAIIRSDGGEIVQLTAERGQSWVSSWSPDGEMLVFGGERDDQWNLYTVSRKTKKVEKLTNYSDVRTYVRYPSWSPVGGKIAYEFAETTGNIWMMELK